MIDPTAGLFFLNADSVARRWKIRPIAGLRRICTAVLNLLGRGKCTMARFEPSRPAAPASY